MDSAGKEGGEGETLVSPPYSSSVPLSFSVTLLGVNDFSVDTLFTSVIRNVKFLTSLLKCRAGIDVISFVSLS